ncbi:MAG: proprotein convertase P-domain-containing protein [Pseudomonadota bacterium]|nr:proprotein convertase P-domain-containing protein [Pseudomonadota bacterium]
MNIKSLCLALVAVFTIGTAGSALAAPITLYSASAPVAICDLCTVTASVDITGHARVIDINALVDITHSYDADLVISLSHGGTTVLLANRRGGSGGADYSGTVFDDQAAVAIGAGYAYAPYAGAFKPEQALAAFFNQDAFGLWTLTVTDSEIGDNGVINRFGIAADLPEPGSMALFGLALMGMVSLRRKR